MKIRNLTALALTAVLATSCIGSMSASVGLKTWNREIEDRVVGEAIYLALHLVPVYPLLFAGDILIFNSIEFWGRPNPILPTDPLRIEAVENMTPAR